MTAAVHGCFPPTGPCVAEENSSCDPSYNSATTEAESKMLSLDPGKETPPSCSLIEEQEERLPLAKPEQEGLVLTFVAFNHTINILLFQCFTS